MAPMLTLQAEGRTVFGKKLKTIRQAGRLPVVVYGPKDKPVSLFVALSDFKKVFATAGESSLITVNFGEESKDVLINDVERHPVTSEPIHADFYVVDKTKTIKIGVPLTFTGISAAVKDLGGTLVKVKHELEVETLPMNIPHNITVDISLLTTLESQILVKDLAVPSGVTVLAQPEEVVASISVAEEEPVEVAPVDLSSIEVEKKGKKEEEAGEASGTIEESNAQA